MWRWQWLVLLTVALLLVPVVECQLLEGGEYYSTKFDFCLSPDKLKSCQDQVSPNLRSFNIIGWIIEIPSVFLVSVYMKTPC